MHLFYGIKRILPSNIPKRKEASYKYYLKRSSFPFNIILRNLLSVLNEKGDVIYVMPLPRFDEYAHA